MPAFVFRAAALRRALVGFALGCAASAGPALAADAPAPVRPADEPMDEATRAKWLRLLATGTDAERDEAHRVLPRAGKVVVPALAALVDGDDVRTGAWAAEALAILGPDAAPAAAALARGLLREGMDWPCANALEAMGAAGVSGLLGGLRGAREGSRVAAVVSLGKVTSIPAGGFDALVAASKDPDGDVRAGAVAALVLVEVPAERRHAAIVGLVADPESDVVYAVIDGVAQTSTPTTGTVEVLVSIATAADRPSIRAHAIEALGRVRAEGDERGRRDALLARALADEDADVRLAGLRGVRAAGIAGTLGPAIEAASEAPDRDLRREAVDALLVGTGTDERVERVLVRALADAAVEVRIVAAAAALRRGKEKDRAFEILFGDAGIWHGDERVRRAVVEVCAELGAAGPEAKQRLAPIAKDRTEEFRTAALRAIRAIDEAASK